MGMMKIIYGCLALMCYAQHVMASPASHGINWWHLGSAYKDAPALGWLSITFVIFVYVVARVVRKPLALYLEARSNDIRQQIEEGRLAKIESEKKLRLYDEKLKSLAQEIDRMKQALKEQAEAEKLERQRQAQDVEARILRETDDTIRNNMTRARNRLAEEVINNAMLLAEQAVASTKRDEVDNVLKKTFLSDLRESSSEAKRNYVINEFVKSSKNPDIGASAREVH